MSDEEDNQEEIPIGLEVPLAVLAGSFFGLGGVYLKKTMGLIETALNQSFNPISLGHWNIMFSSLIFWVAAILTFTGIALWVVALHEGRVTIVGPIVGGFIVFLPVICGLLGIIIEKEPFSLKKAIGILTITIGSMGLARKEEPE